MTKIKNPTLFPDENFSPKNEEKKPSPGGTSSNPKLKSVDRSQMIFRTIEIEKLIPQDHDARAIWEFVGGLDLKEYYKDIRSQAGEAGRSASDPRLMISLWVYSYCKGINSAREMARLCDFDPAFQWLTGMTLINHHSLSDFRADHYEALENLLVEILALLSAGGLITMERVTQDGTKIKANASGKSFRREKTLAEHLKLAQEQVSAVNELHETDEGNQRQKKAAERSSRERKEKLEKAFAELEKLRKIKKNNKEKENARVSMTDPESRVMKQGNGGFSPSYNVQISTDSANCFIVGVAVSQSGNDAQELIPAIDRMEEIVGTKPQQMIVDSGYTTKPNILEADARGIDLIGSFRESVGTENLGWRGEDERFNGEAFSYHPEKDTYTCPVGEKMRLRRSGRGIGHTDHLYMTEKGTCQKCKFQKECCPQNTLKGRSISRKEESPEMVAFRNKMETEEAKRIYKTRSQTAEFSNAWIKEKIGLRQFRLRGLPKVNMEAIWACVTYNIQQWIRLIWRNRWALNRV